MKKVLLYLAVSALVLFAACSKSDVDDVEEEVQNTIEVHTFYTTNHNLDNKIPDVGSKIFIYYDIYSSDLLGYSYHPDGRFTKGDATIYPEQTATIDSEGNATIIPKYTNKIITIAIETKYYGRVSLDCFSEYIFTYGPSIIFTLISHP